MIPTFLIKGGNSRYYFRIKIPADLRKIIGQGEIRRSLKTTDEMLATARSLQLAYQWHQQFEKMRMTNLKDILNNPLNTDLITLHNVKVGDQVVPKVTLDTEEDVVNFNKLQAGASNLPEPAPSPPADPTDPNSIADKKINVLIQDYLNEHNSKWTLGSFQEYKSLFRQVGDLMGNVTVRDVTRPVARDLKASLLEIRRKGKPLSASKINKTLGKMSSVWKHGIIENLGIPDKYNPWVGLQIPSDDIESEEQPAYEESDLDQLFGKQFAKTKAINNRPARYWLPILSLFHGFRIGEVAQLSIDNVFEDDGIWCLRISKEMRRKNKNAIRTVPLHSKVIELGFLDFVDWRRKNIEQSKSTDKRLFIDLKPDGARCAGPVSTWWNGRYSSQFDLTPGVSLHSLRHTCLTYFRSDTTNSETHRAEVAGHIRGETQSDKRYGKTVLLPLQKVVESASYPITIPPWSKVKITHLHIAKEKKKK